jgi:RNA polymerase primary sigma factor
VAAGDREARDLLVRANLRLVVSLARLFARRGVPLEDLVAEGNLGLIRAAERFDPERGTRFSTYASFWVRQAIRQHLATAARPVHLPAYLGGLLGRWGRAAGRLRDLLGRPPSAEEVADALGLSAGEIERSRAALRACAECAQNNPWDEGRPAVEALADPRAVPPEATLAAAEEAEGVRAVLDKMGPRRAAVLRLRYGLGGGVPRTLQEIGESLGITREAVRQLERRALAELADALQAQGGRRGEA